MDERGAMNLVSLESETWKLPIWGGGAVLQHGDKVWLWLGDKGSLQA